MLQRFKETATDGEIDSLVFVNETDEAMSDLFMQQSLVDYAKEIFEKQLLDQSFRDIREYDFESDNIYEYMALQKNNQSK